MGYGNLLETVEPQLEQTGARGWSRRSKLSEQASCKDWALSSELIRIKIESVFWTL